MLGVAVPHDIPQGNLQFLIGCSLVYSIGKWAKNMRKMQSDTKPREKCAIHPDW